MTTNWDDVPWTEFVEGELPTSQRDRQNLLGVASNSRYQVNIYETGAGEPFGRVIWLSIKAHDKSARHDWRDLQRIKNEVVGPEYDAVEIYPAESKLVDTANQYHLWVFLDFKLSFGFNERAVREGNWNGSVQRPFPEGWRPADCMSMEDYRRRMLGANVRAVLSAQAKKGDARRATFDTSGRRPACSPSSSRRPRSCLRKASSAGPSTATVTPPTRRRSRPPS